MCNITLIGLIVVPSLTFEVVIMIVEKNGVCVLIMVMEKCKSNVQKNNFIVFF